MKFILKTVLKAVFFALILTYFEFDIASNYTIPISEERIQETPEWILIAENVEATVYNAVPEQCDNDPLYTASMFRLNLDDVYSHRIIAMEKTFIGAAAGSCRECGGSAGAFAFSAGF